MEYLASFCAALAVLLVVWPFIRMRSMNPALARAKRIQQMSWNRQRKWTGLFGPYLGLAEADRLCQYAGRPYGLTGVTLLQYQFMFALLWAVIFGAVFNAALAVLGTLVAWFMPRILLSSMAGQRRAQIALELPAFLDLWGLLVSSGEGVETALVEICRRHPDWMLTAEVTRVLERVSASGLFGEAIVEGAKVTGSPEFVQVAEQVKHLAEGGGVPSKELARMAEQMREQRVSDLMQSAGAMAVMGIFPKMGAIFLSLTPVIATIVLTVMKNMR